MGIAERRAREKEQRRLQILQAAESVMRAQGIQAANIDTIAKQAELSRGTVYLYFDSKEAIYGNMLLDGLRNLVGNIVETAAEAAEPLERLRNLWQVYFDYYLKYYEHFFVFAYMQQGTKLLDLSPELLAEVRREALRGLSAVKDALGKCVDAGLFREVDLWSLAKVMWASINGVLMVYGRNSHEQFDKKEFEAIIDGMFDIMLRGLVKPEIAARESATSNNKG